ncbi:MULTISPECIES: ATP-dependent zinc metalloprotease FtsH [unclassified Facklamia]|uniref:ATP-dependent zinc metalloprotease FtsH n=1 Tax=Aerococcaceae TaxID=186827 RepID=UPI0013BC57FC|nr:MULTISPECIES: ATP-dependent zinc metalloprotease FtsH [unclassified Facklamia]NEW63837.1 ATP-dependent zinc metalloprotease FtsH [Facklamia sp. 252]NEW67308.1 ATP-dependent zinc metalloprotease FtsH [Facklamia sp. 253]QQD65186.1 ATP-dependent zinc metalloprotease FtsH [Aerococcaceae bacterium zg-252]
MQNPRRKKQNNRNLGPRSPFKGPLFYLIAVLAMMGAFQLFAGNMMLNGNTSEITATEFIEKLSEDKIKSFEIQAGAGSYNIRGEYEPTAETQKTERDNFIQVLQNANTTKRFTTRVLGNDTTLAQIMKLAQENKTEVKTIAESNLEMWLSLIPFLLLIPGFVFLFSMFQQGGGGGRGVMNFGKTRSREVSKEKVKVRFSDVAGAEEEKLELVEIVDFLKNPKKYTDLGARIPAGVLLEGPPGTGKTLLAKAVAGEAGVPFFSISGSEFVEMFVGVGASRVRDLFENAKKSAPAIVFIDEIDAVGRQRGAGMGGGHDEREQTLNQLLVEMDGFEGSEAVIVIAATNRSDVLDPALLRPGRFDRQILVGNPDVKGREAILRVHSRNKKFAPDVDLKVLAQQTPGYSGAELENVLNEAALVAARFNRKHITRLDLDEAQDRVVAGPAKVDQVMSKKQRRTIAFHEAGHTVVGMVLSDARTVHKVTIVPRGRAGGYAIMLPKEDRFIVTKTEMYEQVVGLLGGRVAEEIVFNSQSTGASNDFEQATNLVRAMVTEYGMSEKLGTVQFEGNQKVFVGRQYGQNAHYSEQVAYEIDLEIRRIMREAYEEAHHIINEHREQLNVIAEKLLEVETLDRRQIKALFETGEMPVEEQKDNAEEVTPASYDDIKRKVVEESHEAVIAESEQETQVEENPYDADDAL